MVKVGDIVRIRKDLIVGQIYDRQTFVYDMEKYKGLQLTISIINIDKSFYVKEAAWSWTEEMFEKKSDIIEVW